MNSFDISYLDVLGDIMDNGVQKGDRTGTGTLSRFGTQTRFNLKDNRLPLLSLRKVFHRSFIHETLWFLSGSTDIGYLKENNVSIWDSWVKPGTERYRELSFEECLEKCRALAINLGDSVTEGLTSVDFRDDPLASIETGDWELRFEDDDDIVEGGVKVIYVFNEADVIKDIYRSLRTMELKERITAHQVTDGWTEVIFVHTPGDNAFWAMESVVSTSVREVIYSDIGKLQELCNKLTGEWIDIEPRVLVGGSIGTGAYGSQWRSWEDTVKRSDTEEARTEYLSKGYTEVGVIGDEVIFHREIDQIDNIVHLLKTNPDSRRILLVAFNPAKVDHCQLPPCFTGDTWVATPEGYKQIQDIQEGDMVLSGTGVPREVLQKWTTPYNGKMYSLKVSYIAEKIKCTPNHPFLVKDRGWVDAKDLEKGDLVGIPRNKSKDVRKAFVYSRSGNVKDSVRLAEHWLTEEDYFTLGYFLGNGWCSTNDGRVCFAIPHSKRDHILPKIRRTVRVSLKQGPASNVATYETRSHKWAEFLKEFGHLAHNKSIPLWVYDSPQHCISAFLEGFNEADGCKSSGYLMDVTTTSPGVAYGLQRLTSYIGILGRTGYQIRPETTVIEGRTVNQRNTYQFRLNDVKNRKSVVFEEDVIWIPVNDIEEYEDECIVYNLNVDKEHTYLANNIITHNCHSLVQWWSRVLTTSERAQLLNEELREGYDYYVSEQIEQLEEMGYETDGWSFEDDSLRHDFLDDYGVARRALSCMLYMRSSDYPVGAVFNIPQYALLTHMLAQVTGMVAEELVFTAADCHVYADQEEGVLELLQRKGHTEEARVILDTTITEMDDFTFDDIIVTDYEHDAVIRFPIAV